MSIRHRDQQPVPMAPAHRKIWRRLRRVCTCGLRWPCQENRIRDLAAAAQPPIIPVNRPGWEAPTEAYPQVGSAPRLTRGQAYRGNGGRF
jgi:hypothetical protein